jgi:His/Glu/Gln/Arg/opine family amino acid ABC transporter permease subunit
MNSFVKKITEITKSVTNVKNWKKKTKITVCVVLAVIAVCIVLCALKPSEADMKAQASDEMQQLLKNDETSSRKRVTVTYNSLFIINYCSFSSSGAVELSEKYVGFAGKIFHADEGAGKITGQMVNYTYRMLGCGENILHGAKLTLLLTTLSMVIGVAFGTVLALGKISKNKVISKICSAYIFFFRGTPLLIQLFVIYFTLPAVFGFAWRDFFGDVYTGAFMAALIAYGLNSGAYCAEIVRAAIQSIEKGQHEAAKALGLSNGQTMRLIIIPQSVRRMVPPVCNEFVMMLKDASLVFAISLMDITTISKNIMTSEISYIVFLPALIIYLIITAFFTWIFNAVEKKFSLYE